MCAARRGASRQSGAGSGHATTGSRSRKICPPSCPRCACLRRRPRYGLPWTTRRSEPPVSSRPSRAAWWRAITDPETLYRPPRFWDRAAVCCLVRRCTWLWSIRRAGLPCIPAHPYLSTAPCALPSARTVLTHHPRRSSLTGYRFGSPTSYAAPSRPSGEAQHTPGGDRNTGRCPPSRPATPGCVTFGSNGWSTGATRGA